MILTDPKPQRCLNKQTIIHLREDQIVYNNLSQEENQMQKTFLKSYYVQLYLELNKKNNKKSKVIREMLLCLLQIDLTKR